MAMYESKQGEEDFKISSYYKKDYRSFHTIATIIWVTVGYAVAVGIGVIAFLDELMGNLNMDAYNDMSERIVGARSAEQSVWRLLTPISTESKRQKTGSPQVIPFRNRLLFFSKGHFFYARYFFSSSTLSSFSHGRSRSFRPKCPYAAVCL